ncbi:MAG: T9SS type A sorting domain-containing protein [Bacteroidetes bacterium]|nr:T9SS type A sorting domain-containing protein [Bacteroidota bacterium]
MKTPLKAFLTLTICLFSFNLVFAANEGGEMIVHLEQTESGYLDLHLANLQEQRTEIAIADMNGTTWYREWLNKEEGFATRLKLTEIPNGTYVFYVRNKSDHYAKGLLKANGKVRLFEEAQANPKAGVKALQTSANSKTTANLISYFTAPEANTLGIQLANLNKSAVEVQIHDLNGMPIAKDQSSGAYGYAKKFRLQGMNNGMYYVIVKTASKTQLCFFEYSRGEVIIGSLQELEISRPVLELARR